jgi:hypothetical protein
VAAQKVAGQDKPRIAAAPLLQMKTVTNTNWSVKPGTSGRPAGAARQARPGRRGAPGAFLPLGSIFGGRSG